MKILTWIVVIIVLIIIGFVFVFNVEAPKVDTVFEPVASDVPTVDVPFYECNDKIDKCV